MSPEPSRSELLHRIAELEARVADYETGQTEHAFAWEVAERKRAEQASRESEERLHLFLENIPAAIAMFDRDMRYMAVSGRWAEHFGGAERLLGKAHYEIFPDCPEHWRAGHRRGMAGEIVRVEEDLWKLPDGSDVWSRYEVRPWRTTDGEIGGIIIFTEDIRERKQAEEALRRSERIYRAIGESIDFGVWVCAPDGGCTYASDSLLKLVGLTLEQFSNFGWANILHPDDTNRTVAAWKECVRTEGKWDIEHRCRGVDGNWHPVLARGVPIRDEDGRIYCWAGIALDISALKRTEESLRASEATARAAAAELQAIMDAATAVIVIAHDVEARKVGGNRKANELVHQPLHSNLSRAAAVERPVNFRLMRDGVEIPEGERPLTKVASSGQALRNYELQVVLQDGVSTDLLGNVEPLLDDNGRPRGAIGVFNDITERKRAEAALRDREQELLSIYNTVRDVIFYLAVEPEGRFRFVSVNLTFLRVTGLSPDAVVGRTVNEVIPEASLTMVLEKYRQAVERKAIVSWEETTEYATGRLTGEVTVAPVFDNNGACTHLVGSAHDITEVKRAHEIEKRLLSDLAVSRDEIRALAASLIRVQEDERSRVSRELHDQICHQLGYLASDIDNLADTPLAPENLRAQLTAIRARVLKTSQETHDIAYQMHTAILKDLGLVASLKALCRQFSHQYPSIAVEFENSGPAASIPSEVATCLYRVAQEGLQNTAKHSGARNVSIGLDYKKGAIRLTIRDDGAGFDPEGVKGHGGIGLISMRERAHAVKGKLTITAQPGHGAQITLEIPILETMNQF